MKNKIQYTILLILFVGFLNACSNRIKRDYIIIDASSSKQPKWVTKDLNDDKKSKYKYFVSKSENLNERLCMKSSSARGFANIASEISAEILENYEEVISNNNLKIQSYSNEKLQLDVKMYLAGIETEELYWEKRLYNNTKNSNDTQQKYVCYTLLKMSKENYDKAIKLSIDKMFNSINLENKNEIKQQVENKFLNNKNHDEL